jgi:hypothetical protein
MRGFILGIVILMAVPSHAVGQQRDRSERSATERTAVPREKTVQAAPARRTDRRAEPRRDTRTQSRREATSDRAAQSRAGRERRSTLSDAEAARARWLGVRPQAAPATTRDYGARYPRRRSGGNVVFVPYATPVVVEREVVVERHVVDEPARAPVIVEQPLPARLILDVYPPTAQVFSDGYYIGIPEDFRFEDGGAVLEPGPHRIDILDRDYEPLTFDVNLTRAQTATFRRMLTPMTRAAQPAPNAAAKAPAAPKQPATFYVIPGCYMGNVPPKEANLPATCDIARAVSVQY